jgi:putative transposase
MSSNRQKIYRGLFIYQVDGKLLEEIRDNTYQGMAVGNDRFKEEIEELTGRRFKSKKRGRPVGWRKNDS